MLDYSNIPHPLLSDSGTCQSERFPALLNPSTVKIDDQSLEDILQFVNRYARFVNFYEAERINSSRSQENYELTIGNWQGFFNKSLPFQLAVLSKTDIAELEQNLARIIELNEQSNAPENLELLQEFILNELILIFEESLKNILAADSPFGITLQRIMSSSLRDPLIDFIRLSKTAITDYGVSGIDFNSRLLLANWDVQDPQVYEPYMISAPDTLLAAFERIGNIFINEIRILAGKTSQFLPKALYPTKEEDQGKIAPHVGLILAFLELKKRFTADLNDISRRHLLYFYNDVLQINGRPATPDETYVVFQLQKQVENSYLLRGGTEVKDGKDDNKADIIFALEKDVVLDKAEIKELRTLYLNPVFGKLEADPQGACSEDDLERFTEGLYIAPKANSIDGVEEDFKDPPKNWATLGDKESKLKLGEGYQEHPSARSGFILASPVLYLQEGKRKIDVQLCCNINDPDDELDKTLFEKVKGYFDVSWHSLLEAKRTIQRNGDEVDARNLFNRLLNEICPAGGSFTLLPDTDSNCEPFLNEKDKKFLDENGNFNQGYLLYELSDVIDWTLDEELSEKLGEYLYNQSGCEDQVFLPDLGSLGNDIENLDQLEKLFLIQPFKICLSGEEGWIQVPNEKVKISLLTGSNTQKNCPEDVEIKITIELGDDFPSVTFSDPEALGENIGTIDPSLKIELDPDYKVTCPSHLYKPCCILEHCQAEGDILISAYHFLSYLQVESSCIDVEVCGVKNLIVQNDESVQDVNGLIYPFGTRPRYEKNDAAPYESQGSNFYIGSQEVFCKNWSGFWININWKEKPASFCDYYIGYEDSTRGIALIEGNHFQVKSAVLNDGLWSEYSENPSVPSSTATDDNVYLFNEDDDTSKGRNHPADFCPESETFQRNFDFERTDFTNLGSDPKPISGVQAPFSIDTKDAFVRLTLTNLDFQHQQYPFILARQMMAFGKLEADGESVYVPGAVYYTGDLRNNQGAFERVKDKIVSISKLFNQIEQIADYLFLMGQSPVPNQSDCEDTIPTHPDSLYGKLENHINQLGDSIINKIIIPNSIDFKNINILPADSEPDIRKVIFDILDAAGFASTMLVDDLNDAVDNKLDDLFNVLFPDGVIHANVIQAIKDNIENPFPPDPTSIIDKGTIDYNDYLNEVKQLSIKTLFKEIRDYLCEKIKLGADSELAGVVIPNEPWTPIIKEISIDYTAKATKTDIDLIHLHPFENTYEEVDITATPSLLPTFSDEGTLFIGLDNLTKENTLNLLFHLAEATANTEMDRPDIKWSYLSNNDWKLLRDGFSVFDDETNGLTKSGIIEIGIPRDISKTGHTIMPDGLYWIKAAAAENSNAVCDSIALFTQAAKVHAVLSEKNDLTRLQSPLPAQQINRLNKADTSIKKVSQPIESIKGKAPESEAPNILFQRISERLRHKGRAINGFDYERIVLEYFSQVFKAKTVNHTFGLAASTYVRDMEVAAPGYVLLAVIPDILQMESGNSLEPRLPLSQLEEIKTLLLRKTSPFIRMKILNPRYEKVNVAIKVKFHEGNTGAYFTDLLSKDISGFLAPWTLGRTDRLEFGASLSKSDLIAFVESLYYVDYICHIDWVHEFDLYDDCTPKSVSCCNPKAESPEFITPMTARSILTAGTIHACELDKPCESYDMTLDCTHEDVSIIL